MIALFEHLLNLYQKTLRIRLIEEAIAKRYGEWQMRCPTHLSIGQEAVAVGVCESLEANDIVFSNHRGHAHYLAKGGSLNAMIAELYGKVTGCCGGRGGSMHLIDQQAGFWGSTPIVAGTVPISVGVAWAAKLQHRQQISVIFLGDGCFEEGVLHETMNFASLHHLPVLFVLENNYYSVYTQLQHRQPNRLISTVAAAHGLGTQCGNGMQADVVYQLAKTAVQAARSEGPQFLELTTYRWLEHCGPNDDDNLGYRPEGELANWKNHCPVNYLIQQLQQKSSDAAGLTVQLDQIRRQLNAEIEAAFQFAQQSPAPAISSMSEHVYA